MHGLRWFGDKAQGETVASQGENVTLAPMNVVTHFSSPTRVKLTVADFGALQKGGALDQYHKTELIEGVIVAVNSQYSAHASVKSRLARYLGNALEAMASDIEAISEVSVSIPPHNVPEPDIVLTTVTPEKAWVPLELVALLVEVSDSTLRYDLGKKAKIYARNGVPEYWVVDLAGAKIHQLWSPSATGFKDMRVIKIGDPLESITIAGLKVPTNGLT